MTIISKNIIIVLNDYFYTKRLHKI